MKDLSTLDNQELLDFFNSFDHILSDVDGVVWNILEAIPETKNAVSSLQNLGKQIVFVTNNTTRSIESLHQRFVEAGFDVKKDNVVSPILSIISYLQKQNLDDTKIFLIGMTSLRQALMDAGFQLAKNGPDRIGDNVHEFSKQSIKKEENVGVVIADIDLNLNWLNLQKAATYLEDPNVKFLCGARDVRFPIGRGRFLIGPGMFLEILEKMTARNAISMAKRSTCLNEFIVEKFNITNPERVLCIGDSIPEDMGFGTKFGYKKLLVLSGLSSREDIDNWNFPDAYKPDFYVESLGNLHQLLQSTTKRK